MGTLAKVPATAIMAGGKARRMCRALKPIIEVCGAPMVWWVINAALKVSQHVVVITSPRTTQPTLTHVPMLTKSPYVHVMETPGAGYVNDLRVVTASLRKPLLVLPADIPFITVNHLRSFLNSTKGFPNADVVTLEVKGVGPVGISLFRSEGGEWVSVTIGLDERLTNINTWEDLRKAETLCLNKGFKQELNPA